MFVFLFHGNRTAHSRTHPHTRIHTHAPLIRNVLKKKPVVPVQSC